MRVFCQFSGVSFLAEGFTNKMNVNGLHPIFNVPLRSLLNRAGDWARGDLTETERKLLFLSLLNSTKLVEFRTTANPADSVVQSNMEFLLHFVKWHSDIHSAQLRLPRFVISHDNARLANVTVWLKTWEARKKDWEDGYAIQTKREKLAGTETSLQRLIKSASKDSTQYAGILAKWAMEASNAPEASREYWTELFKLKGLEVYNAPTEHLEKLLEHLEDNIPSYEGGIYAYSVLRHVRTLLTRNRNGLTHGLGIPTEELQNIDFDALAANPFRIIEDVVETENKSMIVASAPDHEPVAREYPNRVAYLRAKAAWNLSNSQKAVAEQIEKEEQMQEQAAGLDAVIAEEEVVDEEDDSIIEALRSNDGEVS